MALAAVPRRLTWQLARVLGTKDETPRCKSLSLELPDWPGHRAGQHVDVRLTAEDGYQAQRSYSIASAPEESRLVLTIERLDDGEVSPYLVDQVRVGDELELRGPIGGYFVWEQSHGGPLLLVAGGAGVVPLRAMLRHWGAGDRAVPARLVYSARSLADVIYGEELVERAPHDGFDVRLTLTREWPENWAGYRGRINRQVLQELAWRPDQRPLVYVCGPSSFVEAVAGTLVEIGHDARRVRTERFGPTGT